MTKDAVDFSSIPDSPGVYFFKQGTTVVYVGKATSLKNRVRSYFDQNLEEKRSPLVAKVIRDADSIEVTPTDSVLEALLLEAHNIKLLKPIGNTDQKDDKSFSYLIVTKERFPRLRVVRGRELATAFDPKAVMHTFGPFTSGTSLKEVLKIVRKIFPFFDTAFPVDGTLTPAQKKTLSFNQSIGVFPPTLDQDAYAETIKHIVKLFEGKKRSLVASLEKEMTRSVHKLQFEAAAILKRQIFALTHINDIALIKDEYRALDATSFRIEAFDTAHLHGESTRAVMAVVIDGEPEKSEYRTFTIRRAKKMDDYEALREVLERRFSHPEWEFPKLIVIDGGRAHLRVAEKVMKGLGMAIELCSVVKDERHKPKSLLGKQATVRNHESSILLANAEAHRFSLGRHRRALRKKVQ